MSLLSQPAPEFTLPVAGGGEFTLSDHHPSWTVLFFYPRDDTSGCTREAVEFTEKLKAFRDCGANVVGVSKDTLKSHDKFITKHDLAVTLASDADTDVCEQFGVWVEKSMYGRKFMGIERATFLIDGAGVVRAEWRKVKVPGHVEAVLTTLRELREL